MAGCEISITDECDELESAQPIEEKDKPAAKVEKKQEDKPEIDLEKFRLNYQLLSNDAKELFAAFLDAQTENFDLALENCELDMSAAIAALTELEIFGFVSAIPGGRYSVNISKEVTDV